MYDVMRTTLIIDDHVLIRAKQRAAEQGTTLSHLTTMALRETLRDATVRDTAKTHGFSLPVYGRGRMRDSSPADLAALRDDGR